MNPVLAPLPSEQIIETCPSNIMERDGQEQRPCLYDTACWDGLRVTIVYVCVELSVVEEDNIPLSGPCRIAILG